MSSISENTSSRFRNIRENSLFSLFIILLLVLMILFPNNSSTNNNSVINSLDHSFNKVIQCIINSSVLNNVFIFSFLVEDPITLTQGNGRISGISKIKSGNSSDAPFFGDYSGSPKQLHYTYCFWPASVILFTKYKTHPSKSVHAEITVRRASRASATPSDPNFVT